MAQKDMTKEQEYRHKYYLRFIDLLIRLKIKGNNELWPHLYTKTEWYRKYEA